MAHLQVGTEREGSLGGRDRRPMGGVRSCAAMKHVGLNVAADPFMSVADMSVNGGFVLSMADDPLCYSSQNE